MTIPVGVLGVGNMGRHHARVYHELTNAELVGVSDVDTASAATVADQYGTESMSADRLFEIADAVSIAVPSRYHLEAGTAALRAGVDTLIEKPIATDIDDATRLLAVAKSSDALLQVGHIERFNPAVQTVLEFVDDIDLVAVDARRLGPPIDENRDIGDGVVLDLMIHDIDILRRLVGADVSEVSALGTPEQHYVTASVGFENGVVGSLTASRATQRKVRELTLTAKDRLITVDYIDRSVTIDRRNRPSYLADDGDLRYRNERIVEQPTVDNGEPLKNELVSFLDAVENGTNPVVTGRDGLEALSLACRIRDAARTERPSIAGPSHAR